MDRIWAHITDNKPDPDNPRQVRAQGRLDAYERRTALAMVAGIIRQERIIIPSGESVVEPDDRIIIFATRDAIPGVEKILAVKLDYI